MEQMMRELTHPVSRPSNESVQEFRVDSHKRSKDTHKTNSRKSDTSYCSFGEPNNPNYVNKRHGIETKVINPLSISFKKVIS
jgi:hypothetical protein